MAKLESLLAQYLQVLVANKVPDRGNISKLLSLRASGLPFCTLRFLLNIPGIFVSDRSVETASAFFFKVGTAVHDTLQHSVEHALPELASLGMVPIGDWECAYCKYKTSFTAKPDSCPWCQHEKFRLHEHELRYRQLTGHVDNSFLLKAVNKYLIIDYKTCTVSKAETKPPPEFSNVQQIGTYTAIKASEGFDMLGWALLYISRNSPSTWYPAVEDKPNNKAFLTRLNRYCDEHEKIMFTTQLDNKFLTWVKDCRMCKTPQHIKTRAGYCKYAKLCSNPEAIDTQLKHVVKFVEKKLPLAQFLDLEHFQGYSVSSITKGSRCV